MVRPRAGSTDDEGKKPKVMRQIAAEAAVWVTRLHGPDRSPEMDRELRAWQAKSAMHREAFERCTDVWMDVEKIKLSDVYSALSKTKDRERAGRFAAFRWAASAAAVACICVALWAGRQWWDQGLFTTDIGEQRVVTLDDGSRIQLNTATRLRVRFDERARTVVVSTGEAIFEVAKDPQRPFVVRAGGSEVVAVGTAFSVRYGTPATSETQLTVTLIEGQVMVRRATDARGGAAGPDHTVAMRMGDRLVMDDVDGGASAAQPKLDRPNLEQVTAWKRSEVQFDGTPLVDAVAEMNRYSRTPIVPPDGVADSDIRVSGLYRTGDSIGFARTVAALLGLTVQSVDGRLVLSKPQ